MKLLIEKQKRLLTVIRGGEAVASYPIALSSLPVGRKQREGDRRTPEGVYSICIVKENGKYGRSLGINYPNEQDARRALDEGLIDDSVYKAIIDRLNKGLRPPWGTALGGEIYIHGGGARGDWTQGCIALNDEDAEALFRARNEIGEVEIVP